jgi:hypothetical protein
MTRSRTAGLGRALLAAAFALALLAPDARAGFQSFDVGTTGAQFLKLGAGARAEGMGEAYGAVVDDATALYWNPAALPRIPGQSIALMHEALPAGINYEYLGYARSFGRFGAAGAQLQYLSQPGIDQTDFSGASTGGTFHPSDLAASVGYGYTLRSDELGIFTGSSLGFTGKYVQSTITKTASTYGADLGFLSAPFPVFGVKTRLAYVAQNLGGKLKFQQAGDPLPTNLKLASSFELTPAWLLAADLNEPVDSQPYLSLGTEYRIRFDQGSFAARVGYNSRAMNQAGAATGLTFGLGAKFQTVGFDYAFGSLGALGMTNYLSLDFSF